MFDVLLHWDEEALRFARGLVDEKYAFFVQIAGEGIVIWVSLFLVGLWILGVLNKEVAKKRQALQIVILILVVFGIYSILNLGFPAFRPGPAEVVGGIKPLIPHPIDNSFPSGHALFSGAFIVGLLYYFPKKSIIALTIIIALVTCIARVIGGVHYFGDILGGFLVGGIGALALRIPARKIGEFITPYVLKIAAYIKL